MTTACVQRRPLVDSAHLLKRVFAVFNLLDGCVLASHDPIPVAGAGIYSTVFRANVNIAPAVRNLDPAFFNSTKGNSSIYTIQQPEPPIHGSVHGTHGTFYYLIPDGIVYYVTFNTTAHEGVCKNNMDMLFALAEMKHLDLPEARAAALEMAGQRISDPGVGSAEHADLSEAIRTITMAQNAAMGYDAAAVAVAVAAKIAADNTKIAAAAVAKAAIIAHQDTLAAAAVVEKAAEVAANNTAMASAAVAEAAVVAHQKTLAAAAVVEKAAEVAAQNTEAASVAVELAAAVAADAIAMAAKVAADNTANAAAAAAAALNPEP